MCRRPGAPAGPRSIAEELVRVVENIHRGSKANDQCATESKSAIRVEKLIYGIHTLHPENGLKHRPRTIEIGAGVRVRNAGVRICRYSSALPVFGFDQFFIGVNNASSRRLYGIDGARSKPYMCM